MSEPTGRVSRGSRLRWVPIAQMRVSPRVQRAYRQSRSERMAADFDLEAIGFPIVNLRDGHYYIVDGQHRVEALKIMGWGDQQIQCECYEGLTEAEEGELFLRRDERTAIRTFDRFRIGVTVGREVETEIDRVVRSQSLVISEDDLPGAIKAVGTLRRVHQRAGSNVLGRSLRLIRDAYGDAGLEAAVIDGLGLLCQRYNGDLDDAVAVERLGKAHGGVNGLLNSAEKIRRTTGNQKGHCVAAAAVEIYNTGRGGKKLPSWWKDAS